jgi:hypothetical protein
MHDNGASKAIHADDNVGLFTQNTNFALRHVAGQHLT